MEKKQGLIGTVYSKTTSVTKETFGTADDSVKILRKGLSSLDPMAQEIVNDAKVDLTDSIVRLATARKQAEATLIEAGYSDAEVAVMLEPTK